MATLMGSILRAASRTDDRFNILTFPTHERYEVGLCKTLHNFYAWRGEGIKDWYDVYAQRPNNYTLLDPEKGPNQIPIDIELDFILSQNKFGQFPIALQLSRQLHLPLISLEHTLPVNTWTKSKIENCKRMKGHYNVFISDFSRKAWGWGPDEAMVIHHGIDTELFSPGPSLAEKPYILSIVNDFANRDWCCGYNLWKYVTEGLPTKLVGNNPGLSQPAKDIATLVQEYRDCRIFLNTSLISPVPTVLLEAMACGCAVVSTATCMIPEIIEHGVNGFLADSPDAMKFYLNKLLSDESKAKQLGEAARQTVYTKFGMHQFIENWQRLFHVAANTPYLGDSINEN